MLDLDTFIAEPLGGSPTKRDMVCLSREEALGVYERWLAQATKRHGSPRETEVGGAHLAQWRVRASDGQWETLSISMQEHRVTVLVVSEPTPTTS